MTGDSRHDPDDPAEDRMLEEAAAWHARLREPAVDARQHAEFEHWLQSDPRCRQAFDDMSRLWEAVEGPVARVLADPPPPATAVRSRAIGPLRLAALAACLAVLAVAGWIWRDALLDELRGDYVTAKGATLSATLADGSVVDLNTSTAVSVDLGPDRRHVRLYHGEAWFEVAHDTERPFVVETDAGEVRVIGTSFNVRTAGGRTIVSLARGRVTVAAAADPARPVALERSRQAVLTRDGVSPPAPFDLAAVSAWRRNQLVFYDTPLESVVAELNRYRAGRIVLMHDGLSGLRVSGVFDTGSPDAALQAIVRTLPVRMVRLTGYLVLLH